MKLIFSANKVRHLFKVVAKNYDREYNSVRARTEAYFNKLAQTNQDKRI